MTSHLDVLPGLDGLSPKTIYCIGRNYAAHATELGNAVPETPVVFLKALTALVHPAPDSILELPQSLGRVDHEIECVLAIGHDLNTGAEIDTQPLSHWIAGVAVGLDLTARDFQEDAKKKGLPWTAAKGRRGFGPIAKFTPLPDERKIPDLTLSLEINGVLKQQALLSQMLFSVKTLLMHLADTYGLVAGDVIFTGTPPGVGPLMHGDRIHAALGFGRAITLSALDARVQRA